MKKKSVLFRIAATLLFAVMLVSLAACGGVGGGGNGGGGGGNSTKDKDKDKTKTNEFVTKDAITILKDLDDYSKNGVYNAASKNYDNKVYDSKPCETQYNKLQRRIEIKTDDVYLGKTESSITKIFTKSTPDGILGAIAKAGLTYDEMVRVVDYLAGDVDATPPDIDSFVKENALAKSWTGKLTGNTNNITLWVNAGVGGKDLNEGWSFFDDWDLYDRLKDYSKSAYNGLSESREKVLNDVGTKELAEDNASWQYRSILEKIYKPAAQGGVDLPGDAAARLATYMLDYATEVCKGMAGGTSGIDDAAKNGNSSAFSTLFRTKVEKPAVLPDDVATAKTRWDPYAGLGDYDTLSYLLGFYDFYKVRGYNSMPGMQCCAQLYGYYYQYNRTYYNVVLQNRDTYTKQLAYEKRDTFLDAEWLEYVDIQRKNYEGSYRYKDTFYQGFYKIHFDFQSRKETAERTVYVIENVISGRTYTGEMQEAIKESKKGIKGQLAMSDWMWCYGSSQQAMKDYNKANTGYQEGKLGDAEAEYEGRFYYEFEQLKVAEFLLNKMSNEELSGALYYNCYGYSGSLISEMQGYSKNYVLLNDGIKTWDKFVKIPSNISEANKVEYAKGKIIVLRDDQAKADWNAKNISDQANLSSTQPWGTMRTELSDARTFDYMGLTEESTGDYVNVWRKRCDYLEDRVVAKNYSCCGQRVSEATVKCPTDHGMNPDGTAMTKDYSEKCAISKFVSDYENVLYYVAAKAKIDFNTPDKKTGNTYKTSENKDATFNAGYTGSIKDLYSDKNKLAYKSAKSMTIKIGATFQKEIITKDGEDAKWWSDATDTKIGNTITSYGPVAVKEKYNNEDFDYNYIYTYSSWYLDEKCRFEFMPEDDIDFNLNIYCGYDVKKEKSK